MEEMVMVMVVEVFEMKTIISEVFLRIPDTTLSGVCVDPAGITIYPGKCQSETLIQTEVLSGTYVIWNSAGDARAHFILEPDQEEKI